jgi:steroid 5-alpha reductase family enzyme
VTLATQLLMVWALAAMAMTCAWQWQRRHGNAGIVDVLWAACLGCSAMFVAATGSGAAATRGLLALLGGIWGARLATHLWRRVRAEAEDGRYRALRLHWKGGQWKFFVFFQGQAILVVLFSLPFVAVAQNPASPVPWLAAGAGIWLVGWIGETTADAQLAQFRRDPRNEGRSCRDGLWRYSRHPNYFFEWVQWFAYPCLAVGSPTAWLAWSGPVVMYVFLRWISGVPFTEAQALRTRGEDYRDYQRSTSMLIPWFPKRSEP